MSLILSSLLFLACPIPPEQAQNQHQNNQKSKRNNSQQENNQEPKKDGENGDVKNGEPKVGEPKVGEPKVGEPKVGEGNVGEGNVGEGNVGEGNVGEPKVGEAKIEDGNVKKPDDVKQEEPEQEEPEMVTDSLLIRVDRIPPKPILPKNTQEDLANDKHSIFSGTIVCDECSATLILRAVPFVDPNEPNVIVSLLTEKEVKTGSFSLLLPKLETPLVLELLVDKDKNGSPSAGEYFAVIDMGGTLIPTKNHTNLILNATKRAFFEAAPPPGTNAPK